MGAECSCNQKQLGDDVPGSEPTPQLADEQEEPLSLALLEEEAEPRWKLPAGGRLSVMMFGMTGAGKSSLANLVAGSNVFAAGDDTASMTNQDSVMKWEAEDASLILLDTIGLGDTEIDQDKVVDSIRDVALSAIEGVDVLLYVMRNVRITDDAITRLIYCSECLWGRECLLNLYIVVTCASRYVKNKEDGLAWINRQVEINWRFKHIYSIVGNNPNRFVFIDNPDPDSGEPELEERRQLSYDALFKTLVLHPKEVIPAFTHAMMRRAQDLTGKERANLLAQDTEVRRLKNEIAQKKRQAKAKAELAKRLTKRRSKEDLAKAQANPLTKLLKNISKDDLGKGEVKPKLLTKTSKEEALDDDVSVETDTARLEECLKSAQIGKLAAQKAMEAKLKIIRSDEKFKQEAERQVQQATENFSAKLPDITRSDSLTVEAGKEVETAKLNSGHRMMKMLRKTFGVSKSAKAPKASAGEIVTTVKDVVPEEDLEAVLDAFTLRVKVATMSHNCTPSDMFSKLGGWKVALTPMVFTRFLKSTKIEMQPRHVGGLWRRGDANCDGQIDAQEFCALFA